MADTAEVFEEMKDFLEFGDDDVTNLTALAAVFDKHGGGITDAFYETLARFPTTAKLIEGRIDSLKGTHTRWMGQLFSGKYDAGYLEERMRIGTTHVRIGLPPYYVEVVMSVIRAGGLEAIQAEVTDADQATAMYRSLVKILDLDLLIINLAYAEERLDRMSSITGMSRKLVENLINRAKK